MLNDNSQLTYYQIVLGQTGEAHIGIEYYNPRMYSYGCHTNSEGTFSFSTSSGTPISSNVVTNDASPYNNYIDIQNLQAGTYVLAY